MKPAQLVFTVIELTIRSFERDTTTIIYFIPTVISYSLLV